MSVIQRWANSARIDVEAAVLGVVIAVLLFPLRFFASQIYIKTIPIVLGVASVLYLVATYTGTPTDAKLPKLPAKAAAALPSVVFFGAAAMVLVATVVGERSVLFYDIAGVVGTLLLAQILFVRERDFGRNLLLVQVVVVAAVIRLPALYVTPGHIGIDIWTHMRLADGILAEGTLDAISDDKHYVAPLYHLYVVAGSLLYGVSPRVGLYLSLGLVMPLSALLVYGMANLFVTERWAVFAAAIFALADYPIEWGIHVIPTSHGLVLFLGVVYLLARLMRIEYRLRDFTLLLLLTLAVILTHQVSTFIMLVLLGAALLARLIVEYGPFGTQADVFNPFSGDTPIRIAGLVVFDAGFTLFTWSFTPYAGADQPFLSLVLSYLYETLSSSAGLFNLVGGSDGSTGGTGGGEATFIQQLSTYIDTTGFLLLLCATFVGCLYVVHRRRASQPTFTLLIATAVMLGFVLGLPLFGIRNFVPQRWIAFMYVPMAVLSVIGLSYLRRELDRRVFVVLVVVFIAVFPSVMVLSSHGTIDSPVFADQHERLSYTEQELAAVDTVAEMTGSPDRDALTARQVLYTDHPYQTVFTRTRSYPASIAILNESQPMPHGIVVYRDYQSSGASYFLDQEQGRGQIHDIDKARLCRPSMGEVYTNGDVSVCSTP
ncbi:MAG: hypothetical protein ACQETI_06560 [Halobacteriota archaeon]